jgi:beta-alanine--pyruvate transaminase
MGATFVGKKIYDAFQQGPEYMADIMHGYTYSGHPLACAAAIATQEVYRDEGLFERAAGLEKKWEEALHSLKGAPHVIDIRNIGLMGAVELDPGTRAPGTEMSRAMEAFDKMFFEHNVVMRFTGNVLAFSPPLIISESQIDEIVTKLGKTLETIK